MQTVKHEVRHVLTEAELIRLRAKIAEVVADCDRLETAKNEATAKHKQAIERRKALTGINEAGAEWRQMDCPIHFDYRAGCAFLRHPDTGKEIEGTRRPLTEAERQRKVFDDEDAEAVAFLAKRAVSEMREPYRPNNLPADCGEMVADREALKFGRRYYIQMRPPMDDGPNIWRDGILADFDRENEMFYFDTVEGKRRLVFQDKTAVAFYHAPQTEPVFEPDPDEMPAE